MMKRCSSRPGLGVLATSTYHLVRTFITQSQVPKRVKPPRDISYHESQKIFSALTFVEALLTVQDGDPEPFETGGSMKLTMVLVQRPIRATHRFIMWFAVVQARALPLTSLMVDHTVLTQTTILVFTRTRIVTVSHKSCKTTNKSFF